MTTTAAGPASANGRSTADRLLFLRAWARAPFAIAAQAPSGARLAAAMAEPVDPARPGLVAEFGAGTGAFTAALLARDVPEERLLLVEPQPRFAALLRDRYPRAWVIAGDAREIPSLLARAGIPLAAAVSGMPILAWPAPERLRLVLACLRLSGGGPFVQFTYFPGSPVPIAGRGVRARVTPTIWLNLWPARVWTYRMPPVAAAPPRLARPRQG